MKTEMTGTGGGRWGHRAEAKRVCSKLRRRNNCSAIAEGLTDFDNEEEDLYEEWRAMDDAFGEAYEIYDDDYWMTDEELLSQAVSQTFNSLLDVATGASSGIL